MMQNEKNTRQGDTQQNKNAVIKNGHSRWILSGIFNACRYNKKENPLLNKYVEDPRLQPSGMTPYFNTSLPGCAVLSPQGGQETPRRFIRPSSSRKVSMRDIGAADTLYPAYRHCGVTDRVARGFTLIELLVVVLIIAVLAAVALPQYQKAVYKAQGREALQFIDTLDKALQEYYLQNSSLQGFNDTTTTIDLPELKHFTFNGGAKLDIGTGNFVNLNLINETGEVAIRSLVGCTHQGWFVPPQPWICTRNITSGIDFHTKPTRTCADYFDCPGITATHVDVGSLQWWEYDQTDCIIK